MAKMSGKLAGYGPVTDPNNTDWSRYKVPSYSQDALDLAIRARLASSRMRRFRSFPVGRRVWFVMLTATHADRSQFGQRDLPSGLAFTSRELWCLSRRKARVLVRLDHDAGGAGSMYPVDYRVCPNCGRVLLGPEAHDYLVKLRAPMRNWHYPDGPACNMDCKPNGRGENGQRSTYRKDRNGQQREV
jgi:hypothetical protein